MYNDPVITIQMIQDQLHCTKNVAYKIVEGINNNLKNNGKLICRGIVPLECYNEYMRRRKYANL